MDEIKDGGITLLIYAVEHQCVELTRMAEKKGANTNKMDD